MGMALSGLASGFDWKSIVDQLVEVSRAPQTRMRREQATNSQKSSALEDVRAKLAALKTSISNLNSQDSLLKKSATIADKNSNWTATATKDTPAGDYNVEMISQASNTTLRGKPNLGREISVGTAISAQWMGVKLTEGDFTINGKTISITQSTTWNDLFTALSPEVTASFDAYDRLTLSSSNGSVLNLGSAADTSNFLQVTRLYGNGTSSVMTQTERDFSDPDGNGLGALKLDVSPQLVGSNLRNHHLISFPSKFNVNGEEIEVFADDSIQDILDKITSSDAQVAAFYDGKKDQIYLQNKKPGNSAIHIEDITGRTAEILGITTAGSSITALPQVLGKNATFRINGGSVLQAQSSTITENDHGITGLVINANSISSSLSSSTIATTSNSYISAQVSFLPFSNTSNVFKGQVVSGEGISPGSVVLDKNATGVWISSKTTTIPSGTSITFTSSYTPTKITVAGDTSAAKDALNDFVAKYNAVQDTIEKYTKVTTSGTKVTSSILSGNRELSDIARKLRTELYTSSGLTGTVNRLSDLGVTSSGIQNTVSFNSSVLDAKLASASDDVNAFFKDTGTSAFMTRVKTNFLDKLVTDAGSATGGLQAQLTSFTKQNTNLDKQIEEVERRLAAQRATLEASFIAMEKAQSRFQQQGSYLAKTFANQN